MNRHSGLAGTLALLATAFVACAPSRVEPGPSPVAADTGAPVWSIDLVRTLPGAQLDYVHSIEANWAGAAPSPENAAPFCRIAPSSRRPTRRAAGTSC